MEAHDFLDQAEALLESYESEADLRTAVSRAYYAAYHKLQWLDLLPSYSTPPKGVGSHGSFSYKLKTYPSKHNSEGLSPEAARTIKALGNMLHMLHGKRVIADYDLKEKVTKENAEAAIEMAKGIIEKDNAMRSYECVLNCNILDISA